ncbi:hypothetical protein DFS34DRAFT_393163 [Phlyctochytrium arcticum]|nr:hypothetical protein DFS34DRAFT_393163 [Phlyctochytrium arcticum]
MVPICTCHFLLLSPNTRHTEPGRVSAQAPGGCMPLSCSLQERNLECDNGQRHTTDGSGTGWGFRNRLKCGQEGWFWDSAHLEGCGRLEKDRQRQWRKCRGMVKTWTLRYHASATWAGWSGFAGSRGSLAGPKPPSVTRGRQQGCRRRDSAAVTSKSLLTIHCISFI